MKRDIEWVEKAEPGIKRKVRVRFLGGDRVKWQFKRSDEDVWNYDIEPTPDDWAQLEEKIEGLYNRRRAPYKHLELVRKLKSKAD